MKPSKKLKKFIVDIYFNSNNISDIKKVENKLKEKLNSYSSKSTSSKKISSIHQLLEELRVMKDFLNWGNKNSIY